MPAPPHPPAESPNALLHAADDHELYELVRTRSLREVAELFRCDRKALYNRRQTPGFKKAISDARREVEAKIAACAEDDLDLALGAIRDILAHPSDDHARLNAARLLLTVHDNGKAPETVDADADLGNRELLERVEQATAGAMRAEIRAAEAEAEAAVEAAVDALAN